MRGAVFESKRCKDKALHHTQLYGRASPTKKTTTKTRIEITGKPGEPTYTLNYSAAGKKNGGWRRGREENCKEAFSSQGIPFFHPGLDLSGWETPIHLQI